MKTKLKFGLVAVFLLATIYSVSAQVFIAKAALEEFYADDDIAADLKAAGYRQISPSEMPAEAADPLRNLTNYIDQEFGDSKKRYYINDSNGALLLYGVENDSEGLFLYAVNFFPGNENAVTRIREFFTENDLNYDGESDGQHFYSDGEEAGGLVGMFENGMVMFAYFEP